jgi:hypothetical protein
MVTNPFDEALSDLPKKVRDRVKACPKSGQGVHQWLFGAALSLTSYFDDAQIIEVLEAYVSCRGREQEIEKAVSSARRIAKGEGVSEPRSLWPAIDYTTVHKIVVDCPVRLKDLRSMSPMDLSGEDSKTEEIIDSLFLGNPLLCFGREVNAFWTRPREFWRTRESTFQFIVPNPMTKERGMKSDGKESERCLDNTGPRKYLVVEFDISENGPWAPYIADWRNRGITVDDANVALLLELALRGLPRFPLVLAVHSGGKSVHSWFPCEGFTDEQVRPFMYRAVSLGADKATWTKCQFVRMPDGTRDIGKRQRVHYFAPGVVRIEGGAK